MNLTPTLASVMNDPRSQVNRPSLERRARGQSEPIVKLMLLKARAIDADRIAPIRAPTIMVPK